MAAVRGVYQESPALQVHAAQASRRATQDREGEFALALAKDLKTEADDLTPRLIAAQVTAIHSTLFCEAERSRRVGEKPEEIQAKLRAAACQHEFAGGRHSRLRQEASG